MKKQRVNLTWKPGNCAQTYTVIVRQNNKNGRRVAVQNTRDTGLKTIPLEPDKWYAWRVKPCNQKGCMFSGWRRFSIKPRD